MKFQFMVILLSFNLLQARQFSISGFSSGAFMSHQMHIAYSSSVKSAGIVSGGPYYCSEDSVTWHYIKCMQTSQSQDSIYLNYLYKQNSKGTIDNISHLSNTTVFVYTGYQDHWVPQNLGKSVVRLYQSLNVPTKDEFNIRSNHAWITENYGNPCQSKQPPFINNCRYDLAGIFLKFAWGQSSLAKKEMKKQRIFQFDQRLYQEEGEKWFEEKGFVYFPEYCEVYECKVHLQLHGCKMAYRNIGDTLVMNSGLNQWAEGSGIIVIYPQSGYNEEKNPNSCWDYWGFTGENYVLKEGKQMKVLFDIAQKLPVSYPYFDNILGGSKGDERNIDQGKTTNYTQEYKNLLLEKRENVKN